MGGDEDRHIEKKRVGETKKNKTEIEKKRYVEASKNTGRKTARYVNRK